MVLQPSAGYARVGLPAGSARPHHPSGAAAAGFPLIVHADDFGETREITAGICLGIEAGVVTSTSIMANMPGTQDALQRVQALAARASFGVHLNLCEGRPLRPMRTLVDRDGCFHGKRELFARAVGGQLSLADLEAEISAQIALVRDFGVCISHADGHKHLHQLPVVSTAVANVLPRFAIQRVRITRLGGLSRPRRPATWVRELCALQASRKFRGAGLRSPLRTVDLRPWAAGSVRANSAGDTLIDPVGAVELCCHPGTAAGDVRKPGSHRRFAELEYLLSGGFSELLSRHRARLISYWDV